MIDCDWCKKAAAPAVDGIAELAEAAGLFVSEIDGVEAKSLLRIVKDDSAAGESKGPPNSAANRSVWRRTSPLP